jgi:DNA invertase Pin-like site-specific DNA recombinase
MSKQPDRKTDGKNTREITPTHLKREAWVYCRQSTETQKRENEGSALVQRNQVEIASAFGWPHKLIKVIDQDLGKSGSATELRYGWKEMLEAVARNQIGAIFVVDLSRLSRQMLDFEKLRILASYHGVLFVVDGRIVDPKDPNDVVMSQITAALAMYGNRQDSARKTAARLDLARHGKIVSPLPVGWIKKSDGTYDFDSATAPIIRHAIQTFFQGWHNVQGSPFAKTRGRETPRTGKKQIRVARSHYTKTSLFSNEPNLPRTLRVSKNHIGSREGNHG